ncbi:MAG: AMP-binding protein [Dehalococcoidia bacterium]|nr:AMP-binding protein [Dehalococcoidia bacterium]
MPDANDLIAPGTPPAQGPLNLARACIETWATDPAHAQRPAFTFLAATSPEGDRTWTFEALWADVQRIARGFLARGLRPGDRVLVRVPHSPEYALAFLGATLAGGVPIPASPVLTREEAEFLVTDAEAAFLVATPDLDLPGFAGESVSAADLGSMDGPGPLPETAAEDPAYLIYTSGSTARPKGVLHAHRTLRARRLMRDAWQGFTPSDRTLHAGTLNWSYTLGVGLLDAWAAGAHAHLVEQPVEPARWVDLIERLDVAVFVAVPTIYRQMLKYGDVDRERLRGLRHGLCAGEALTPALLEEWRAAAGLELYEALGMTEVSTYISTAPGSEVRPGSAGKPQPGRRVAILEEREDAPGRTTGRELPRGEVGLLCVHRSDPGLMLGYWRRPEEEAQVMQGEWFVGGDQASMDEDGYIWFAGRADDIIKSFGLRLSPVEIETELARHPALQEVAVVGLPVDPTKTLVAAAVVPREGARPSEDDLRAFAREHLAEYKQPHIYRLVESLPRTRNGKIQRRVLAQHLLEESGAAP